MELDEAADDRSSGRCGLGLTLTRLARLGQFQSAFEALDLAESFAYSESAAAAEERVADDWVDLSSSGSVLALTPTLTTAERLNKAIREKLIATSYLGPRLTSIHVATKILDSRQDARLPTRDLELRAGERVVFLQDDVDLGVIAGLRGVLRAKERRGHKEVLHIAVPASRGKRTVLVDPQRYSHLSHGYAAAIGTLPVGIFDQIVVHAATGFNQKMLEFALARHRHDIRIHGVLGESTPAARNLVARKQLHMLAAPTSSPAPLEQIYSHGILPHSLHKAAGRSLHEEGEAGGTILATLRRQVASRRNALRHVRHLFAEWLALKERAVSGYSISFREGIMERAVNFSAAAPFFGTVLRKRAARRAASMAQELPAVRAKSSTPRVSSEPGPVSRSISAPRIS